MDIEQLSKMDCSVRVEVSPDDLRMFAESVVERTLMAHQRIKERDSSEEETYLTTKEVRKILGVCEGTLITWAKRGYLVPVKVGNKNRYPLSAVKRIQTGDKAHGVDGWCKRNKQRNDG